MGVPQEIRSVPRPRNTVVLDTHRDSLKRYVVRERAGGGRKDPDGNYMPKNGKTVGYIVDGRFIPKIEKDRLDEPLALAYGAAAFAKSVSEDLLDDLIKVFELKDAYTIMAIAALRVIDPGIPCGNLSRAYNSTFVSVFYPHLALSRNSVGTFLDSLGHSLGSQRKFYHLRLERVAADHHIAIDGMLKQDSSSENSLSAVTARSPVKALPQLSLLYAYDIELKEPVSAEVFPGNMNDSSAYGDFIRDNEMQKGIVVDDKGFPVAMIEAELKDRPNLHFLAPIRRNDTRIRSNDMLNFDRVLEGFSDPIACRKNPDYSP